MCGRSNRINTFAMDLAAPGFSAMTKIKKSTSWEKCVIQALIISEECALLAKVCFLQTELLLPKVLLMKNAKFIVWSENS